jgi:hypothetical protein
MDREFSQISGAAYLVYNAGVLAIDLLFFFHC